VENLTCSVQPHDVQPALTPRGDEYNEHVGALDALLGLNGRTAERSEHQIEPVAYDEVLTFTDPTFGEGRSTSRDRGYRFTSGRTPPTR
jgi:hypothetical protein